MKKIISSLLATLLILTAVVGNLGGVFSVAAQLTNLYDNSAAVSGWVNGSGETSPDGAFRTSAPISVTAGDVITFGAAVTTQGWHLAVFDSNGNAIGQGALSTGVSVLHTIDGSTSIMSYTVPNGGATVKMVADARYAAKYLVTRNDPFTVAQYEAFFNPNTDSKITNLYDETNAFAGYIDGSGNQVETSGFITLAPVSVSAGDVVTFGAAVTTQGFHIVLINSNGMITNVATIHNGISQIATIDDTTSVMSYTIPADIAQIRMIVDTANKSRYLYTVNNPFTLSDYKDFFSLDDGGDNVTDDIKNSPLYKKAALFCGDSISYGQWDKVSGYGGWGKRIGDKYSMNVTNNSMGGYSLSTCRDGRIIHQLNAAKNGVFDYVILQGGVNDAWGRIDGNTAYPAAPGKMTDSFNVSDFDTSTYAGGLEELFYYAKQYFPNARIGYIVTFSTPNAIGIGNTTDMEPYYSEGIKICEKWGIQVLDLYHNRYVNNDLMKVTTYECLKDPIHPNETGYERLTPFIEDWMNRMPTNVQYIANPQYNKRALFCGDSISYGHNDTPQGYSWAGRIGDSLNVLSDNQSRSGWSVSTVRAANIVQQLEGVKDNNYEYVILHGGTNDAWSGAPVGEITDSYNPGYFDTATFAGALENLFYYAYRYFPEAAIGYIINFRMPSVVPENGTYADMGVYYDVAIEICNKWKVPYLDLYTNEAVTKALNPAAYGAGTNMADAGHPNKAGYDVLNPFIKDWFQTVKYADISSFEKQMPQLSETTAKMPYEADGVLYINECEKNYGWTRAFNTDFALDGSKKQQGRTSLKVTGNSPAADSNKIAENLHVGAMVFLTFPQTADLSGYDNIVYDYYLSTDMTGKQGSLQLNFATNGEDGYNTSVNISGLSAGWHTATISTNNAGFNAVPFEWNKINKIRFTWWNNNSSVTEPMQINIDNIRMTKNSTPSDLESSVVEIPSDTESSDITTVIYGDLDGQDGVTAVDALMALQAAVNKIVLTQEQAKAANVDGEGVVTSADALCILQYAVEKMDKFPVEK